VLRDLEEREILQRDGEGQLVHSDVDWETVPARVEGIIARRIERLDDNLREALIIGCIEGEYFSAEVIARLLDLPVPLVVRRLSQELDRRHRLVRAQGIRSLAGKRRSIYQFRHNLFQTYLYEQLDDIERVYYHESVGTVLEGMAAGQVEEAAVELGYHFRKANQPEKAMRYLTLAGDAALNLHAYTEAVLQYQQAHNLIDRQQMEGASLTALTLKLGRALELNSQFAAAVDIYSELKVLARERSDKVMELAALTKRMTLQSFPSVAQDLAAAIADGDYALALAQDVDDQKMEATIQGILTVAYSYTGQLDLAIEAGDRSLNLARQIDDQALLAQTLHDVGMFNFLIGRFLRSIELLEEAGELWRGMDNQPMLADAFSSVCVGYVYTGQFVRADAHSEAAKFISETIDNTWGRSYSQYMIGIAHWERGRGGQAIAAMGECIEFATEANFLPGQTKGRSDLGIVYAELGDLRKGLQLAKLALEIALANDSMDDRVRIVGQLVFVHILKGELELAQELIAEARSKLKLGYLVSGNPFLIAETELAFKLGDIKRAQANIGEVWGRINELDLWLYAPQMLLQQGRLQLLIGQELEARKSFTEARRIGEKIGSRRMLWRIYYQLSALAEDAGEKKRLRQQAQDLVHFIAQHSGSPELSVSFLNLPDVEQVLAERLAN